VRRPNTLSMVMVVVVVVVIAVVVVVVVVDANDYCHNKVRMHIPLTRRRMGSNPWVTCDCDLTSLVITHL